MTPFIRFYRDQCQLPRVQTDPEQAFLADYLESDLQDTGTAVEMLAVLKKTAEDKREISGNSYTVILNSDQITLECLFDDEAKLYHLPIIKFQLILTGWIQFLDNDSLLSFVPNF